MSLGQVMSTRGLLWQAKKGRGSGAGSGSRGGAAEQAARGIRLRSELQQAIEQERSVFFMPFMAQVSPDLPVGTSCLTPDGPAGLPGSS